MAESRQFVLPQPKRRSSAMLTWLTPGELWVMAVAVATGMVLLFVGRLWGAVPAVGVVLVALVLVKSPYRGRTRYRWWEIGRAHKRLVRTGEARWVSSAGWSGFRGDGTARELDPGPPGVGRLVWSTIATARGDAAMVHQLDAQTYTVAVEVSGDRTFVARDTHEQEQLIVGFSTMLEDLGSKIDQTGVSRLSWVSRVTPEDPQAHLRYLDEVTDVAAPSLWRDSYLAVNEAVQGAGEAYRCWCVMSFDVTSDLLARAAEREGPADVALGRVVAESVEDVIAAIEGDAGLAVTAVLSEAKVARLIHTSFDPRQPLRDVDGSNRATAWPAAVDASPWGHVEARARGQRDPVLLATGWISGWPRGLVGLNFLNPLLVLAKTALPRTTVVVMDLAPTQAAYTQLQEDRTSQIGQANARAEGGAIDDPMADVAGGTMTLMASDLAAGAIGVTLSGWVTVAGETPNDLKEAKRAVGGGATNAGGMTIEWCDGEQYRALLNTLPLGRGLLR